ncbi:MAG TPA: hypothetical protein VHZ02_08915, partial [Acidimicrobiales bacterium]|nr:hypothetical protein [Acidimicrobiales bacterium]
HRFSHACEQHPHLLSVVGIRCDGSSGAPPALRAAPWAALRTSLRAALRTSLRAAQQVSCRRVRRARQ